MTSQNSIPKIVVLATSGFALPILSSLHSSDRVDLVAVVSRPDKPAGRGKKITSPPVVQVVSNWDIEVFQPEKLDKAFSMKLQNLSPDLLLSASFGVYLPERILELTRFGVVNIHPSPLPFYRGAAPVVRTIIDGVSETAVSFMVTDSGWDSGPVLASYPVIVREDDTTGTLEVRLSSVASEKVVDVILSYISGEIKPVTQKGTPTFAEKIQVEETILDWTESADILERKIRAFQPRPGARTIFRNKNLKIISAKKENITGKPGVFISFKGNGPVTGCGKNSLRLLRVQPEGKKVIDGDAFIRGYRIKQDEFFG